jgi:hypothetical protein
MPERNFILETVSYVLSIPCAEEIVKFLDTAPAERDVTRRSAAAT